MSYRYPFTPYPKGWYRIEKKAHVWAFGKHLKLQQLPDKTLLLTENVNPQKIYPVIEKNGSVYVFHDAQNHHPYFDVPEITEFNSHHWQKPFYLSWKSTKVHAQEVAENALDLSHFCVVHTYQTIPKITAFKIFAHQFNVVMSSQKKILGFITDTEMDITYHGMGIVVANVKSANGILLKVLLTTTPIDHEHVDIYMGIAIKKTKNILKNVLLRQILPREIRREFSRDIPVWESKIYRSQPLLCQSEANIIRIRKWAKQFYAETSSG